MLLQPGDAAPPGRPQALDLFGDCYRPGRQSLVVSYSAGYARAGRGADGSSRPRRCSSPPSRPTGRGRCDLGVVYAATGAPLSPVAIAPGAGQYSVSGGVYAFSAADAGQSVSLSYGYVPQDIAQAALELAAERFRAAERIGLRSKSLGGQETIAYDTSALSAPILALLQPYRRVAI